MRLLFCTILGLAILVVATIDVIWTTLGTHGGGPVSRHLTSGIWNVFLSLHRRWPNHRRLSFVGSGILALIVGFWLVLVGLGAFIIYSGKPDSIVDSQQRRPATAEQRLYFVGYTMFTYGNGDYVPNGPWWRFGSILLSGGSLCGLTLAITFIMQVLTAVVMKRTLASYISDVGGSPAEVLTRSWTGERFYGLDGHFAAIATMLHNVTEQHLAYPVLHYFHSEKLRTASTVRIASLYEVALILEEGIAPHLRLARISILPLRDALRGYCEVMADSFVSAAEDPAPPPSLKIVRDLGAETVSDAEFEEAVNRERTIRRFLGGLIQEDGWQWRDVERR